MNNYLYLSALPVYLIAGYLIYKRRKIYKNESLKKIAMARVIIESNKEKINIKDANSLFNSLDVLRKIVNKNKKFNNDEEKEWREGFTLSVNSLKINEYDKKALLSTKMVLDASNNAYNFTFYSILFLVLSFIAQITFLILDILNVI